MCHHQTQQNKMFKLDHLGQHKKSNSSIEYTALRVNPNINPELQMLKMCPYRFINCKKKNVSLWRRLDIRKIKT